MVAEETNTASFASVSANPCLPNSMVSVCAPLTTTLTTMSAPFAASAGVFAPLPPSATNRATASSETSQPATSRPARLSEVAMPKPIEPSPMTATRAFEVTDSGMRQFLWDSSRPTFESGFAPRYHGLAALPKHETRRQKGCCHDRNQGPRGNLPPRPFAVRARADAGLVGQYQRKTRRRRLAGDPDQRLSRLTRPGAAVAGRHPGPARLRRCPDQGSAPPYGLVSDARLPARGGASAFDAFGRTVDAAGDRPARRIAADDRILRHEVRRDRAGALLSARRSGRRRCHQGPRRQIFIGAAGQSWPGGIGRIAGGCGVCDRGTGRNGKTLFAAAWAEPALPDPGAGNGFVEGVRADATGAWARLMKAVIPGRSQRVRARRGPMTGSASNPESRDSPMRNCASEVWSFGPSRNDSSNGLLRRGV